jgi:hypothetical protein
MKYLNCLLISKTVYSDGQGIVKSSLLMFAKYSGAPEVKRMVDDIML